MKKLKNDTATSLIRADERERGVFKGTRCFFNCVHQSLQNLCKTDDIRLYYHLLSSAKLRGSLATKVEVIVTLGNIPYQLSL